MHRVHFITYTFIYALLVGLYLLIFVIIMGLFSLLERSTLPQHSWIELKVSCDAWWLMLDAEVSSQPSAVSFLLVGHLANVWEFFHPRLSYMANDNVLIRSRVQAPCGNSRIYIYMECNWRRMSSRCNFVMCNIDRIMNNVCSFARCNISNVST